MGWKDSEAARAYRKAHYEANREKYIARAKAWRSTNLEKAHTQDKERRKNNPARDRERHKKYYEANREKEIARIKKWREDNRERVSAVNKAWCKANREKLRSKEKAWREANPHACIKSRYRWRHGIELPDQLVELIAINLKIKRELREKHC